MMTHQKRKRRGCFGCLFRLILYVAILWAITMLAINYLPFLELGTSGTDLAVNTALPDDWMNILLLGNDSSDAEQPGRTDTILIASMNKSSGEIKLTSIMRDTMVDIPDHGNSKINAAYRYGGADLAMRTVNQAFGTNITKYVVVDFKSFPYLIDAMGGVRLTVTEEELEPLNRLVLSMMHLFQDDGTDVSQLSGSGENLRLTGLQALAYSRIRAIDSDYARASRQRSVLDAMLTKARSVRNPATLLKLAQVGFQYLDTNISMPQLGALGGKVLLGEGSIVENRLPYDGTYESGTQDGVWSIRADLAENRELLKEFIYGG